MEILNFIVENRLPKAAMLFAAVLLCVVAGVAIVLFPVPAGESID